MDAQSASRDLEVIRKLMERTYQYQFLTARAGLIAGFLATCGALSFLVLDATDPWSFGAVWGIVFFGSTLATVLGTVFRARERDESIWTRQTEAVVAALAPAVFTAFILTLFFFSQNLHLWLPGVWMLCYGQGALATSVYAPRPIRLLGLTVLLAAGPTIFLGSVGTIAAMGCVFGLGHMWLGVRLLLDERHEPNLRLHRTVA